MLGQRGLDVLWVLSRVHHATEKMIREELRRHGRAVRNRHEVQRTLRILVRRGLIAHDRSLGMYVLQDKKARAAKDAEVTVLKGMIKQWDRIIDERYLRQVGMLPWEEKR